MVLMNNVEEEWKVMMKNEIMKENENDNNDNNNQ